MARDKNLVKGGGKRVALKKSPTKGSTPAPPRSPKVVKPKVTGKVVSPVSEVETEADSKWQASWMMEDVYQKASEEGISIAELTQKLNYSAGYLFHLRALPHKCNKLGIQAARKFAAYLDRDLVTVMVSAGMITAEDCFPIDETRRLRGDLLRTVKYISEDEEWSVFVPRPVEMIDNKVLMLIVYAYQKATGRELMTVTSPQKSLVEALNRAKKRGA